MRNSTIVTVMAVVAFTAMACSTVGSPSTGSSGGGTPTPSVSAVQSASGAGSATAPLGEWSYGGDTGPADWGAIAPACANAPDSTQSPIDIETAALAADDAASVVVQYEPTPFELENNGHTIEAVLHGGMENSITIDGVRYHLQQFHFHAPSEHQLDGVNTAMELHLVHRSDAGELAVLGVLLDSGAASEPLTELFTSIPAQENEESPVELHQEIDLAGLIPTEPALGQYPGSLTTPPCTDGVRWNVFLTPITLSDEQIAAYTAIYPNNSRPVQPLNGRTIVKAAAGG